MLATVGCMAIAREPVTVIDCPDPAVLAEFYGALLGWEARADDDGSWAEIRTDSWLRLCFQRVDNFRAPEWPGQEHPQQSHLDLTVDDLDAAEQATLALGATKHEYQPGTTFRVFLDPAGHPFCLCAC